MPQALFLYTIVLVFYSTLFGLMKVDSLQDVSHIHTVVWAELSDENLTMNVFETDFD